MLDQADKAALPALLMTMGMMQAMKTKTTKTMSSEAATTKIMLMLMPNMMTNTMIMNATTMNTMKMVKLLFPLMHRATWTVSVDVYADSGLDSSPMHLCQLMKSLHLRMKQQPLLFYAQA